MIPSAMCLCLGMSEFLIWFRMQKAVSGMFVQIHEALDKGFAESFKKNEGVARDDGALLKGLEESVANAARSSEHSLHVMFSKTAQE